jgi:hypothetical protein
MDPLSTDALVAAQGVDVVDQDGDRIGAIEDIYYDDATGEPEWVGIGTGIFGLKRRVVPVEGARLEDGQLRVPYDKDMVKDSPDVDDDEISAERETDLYAYYGLTSSAGRAFDARTDRGGRIGSDLEPNRMDEVMGAVGAPGERHTPQHDEPLYGDEARVGPAAGDVGMRAPELDLDEARMRQTGEDVLREHEADASEVRRSRLRRWAG